MNGKNLPEERRCYAIAKALDLPVNLVLERAGYPIDTAPEPVAKEPIPFPAQIREDAAAYVVELRMVPIADVTVHAGQIHWTSTERIPVDAGLSGDLIGVRVEGDCLSPAIEPGDIVVVDRADRTLREGNIVVVVHDGNVLLRRVQRDSLGEFALVSNYDIGRPNGAILLGRVVQQIRKFR